MHDTQIRHSSIYDGSVSDRLEVSKRILSMVGGELKQDPYFQNQLSLLQEYAEALDQHMASMELGTLCGTCAASPSGGCCSRFMSAEVDAVQLLLNSLAGIEVKVVQLNGQECLFLGERGCIFLFKPMFCLNYTCKHIYDTGTPADLHELEKLAGKLLGKQYQLEQHILNLLLKGAC